MPWVEAPLPEVDFVTLHFTDGRRLTADSSMLGSTQLEFDGGMYRVTIQFLSPQLMLIEPDQKAKQSELPGGWSNRLPGVHEDLYGVVEGELVDDD